MYHVFLMYEKLEEKYRISSYLQLSGCKVLEGEVKKAASYEKMILESDLVLIYHGQTEECIQVCEFIRMLTQIPVIIMSKEDDEWVKIRLFQAGIDDYIVEPCPQGELLARIQARINRHKSLVKPFGYIENGELVIDSLDRRVIMRGVEVFMTVKEFDMLLYLARRPNQVITKEEIFSGVWSDELGSGYYNAVAAYVNRLRKKIESDPNNPQYIETVWGVGYRFRNHSAQT